MTLELKDIIYILVYVLSISSVFFAFRNELKNLKDEQRKEKNVIWQDGGRLNLVDHKACREYRDILHEAIRQRDITIEEFRAQFKTINENLIRVMTILEQLIKKNEKES